MSGNAFDLFCFQLQVLDLSIPKRFFVYFILFVWKKDIIKSFINLVSLLRAFYKEPI